ncbi:MAG: ImmA/IrrE family metallo-endopeptidase [Candidatus Eisenbacteria bacterium]|nr:ImmA/IrrE family metallo-endopeptidase [Candidatus Eisenbacteria bacterium]MCC7141364.1 ImmA/IrrE family metallo-endopeptidase [Candidatus Eisenbacteria bacterium]
MSHLHPRLEDHPDYPFRPETQARRRKWLEAFLDRPPLNTDAGELVAAFLDRVANFAFLERLIDGDVRFELPVHPEALRVESEVDPEEHGDRLARSELDLFAFDDYPAAELHHQLEEMGIKVVHANQTPEGDLHGGFCFEGEIGPAILVGADQETREASFILAHELAHLVIDVDPYRSRCCRWDPRSFANRSASLEERRADQFALSLLLPQVELAERAAEAGTPPRLDVLTALFGVPEVLIARRLAQFGLEIPAPRASASSGAPAESEAPALKPALPARYVHLAIAAWAHRLLERDRLALFLSVPEIETQAMIEWLGVERLPEHDETEN